MATITYNHANEAGQLWYTLEAPQAVPKINCFVCNFTACYNKCLTPLLVIEVNTL